MVKEYFGCAYHRPPLTANPPDIDRQRIRQQIVPHLPGRPVYINHDVSRVAGRIQSAWQDENDGSLFVSFSLRDTEDGRVAEQGIRSKQMLGLSLGHSVYSGNDVAPLEVSICEKGKRPCTFIYNASAGSSMNMVACTPPVFLPVIPLQQKMDPSAAGAFANLNPGLKAALENAFASHGIDTSNMPAMLRQFNPNAYQNEQLLQQQQAAQAQLLQQQTMYQNAQNYIRAFEQAQAQAQAQQAQAQAQQAPAASTVAPMDEEKTGQGKKRSANEAELDLRRELEEKQKLLKRMSDERKELTANLFEELDRRVPATLGNRAAVMADLRSQVDASENPAALIKTLMGLYAPPTSSQPAPPGGPSLTTPPAPAAAPAPAAPAPAPPAAAPPAAPAPAPEAMYQALANTIMQNQQQKYVHQPAPAAAPSAMRTGGILPAMAPNQPFPLPPLSVVQASENTYGAQTQLEQALYAFIESAKPYVGPRIRVHPENKNSIYGRK